MLFEQANGEKPAVPEKNEIEASLTVSFLGPIEYHNGAGSFSGYWDTLSVKWADEHETILYWDIYLCWTGVVAGAYLVCLTGLRTLCLQDIRPPDFVTFHVNAINNVTSILNAQGQLTGHSVAPVSF